MNAFTRSWRLFQSAWAVLQQDRELVWFPVLSIVLVVIASIGLGGIAFIVLVATPGLREALAAEDRPTWAYAVSVLYLFVYYLIIYFIGNYFMTGLAGAVLMRLEGHNPTFSDGMRIARSRMGVIFAYSALAATVGVILNLVRSRSREGGNMAGALIAGIGEFAWGVATFLVVPVLAARGVGPIAAIRESVSLLRRTWGEQLVGNAGIGLLFGILIVLTVVVTVALAIAMSNVGAAAVIAAIVFGILVVAVLGVLSSTLSGIYKAAVFRYAAEGDTELMFDRELITHAFRSKGA